MLHHFDERMWVKRGRYCWQIEEVESVLNGDHEKKSENDSSNDKAAADEEDKKDDTTTKTRSEEESKSIEKEIDTKRTMTCKQS